MMMEYDDGNMDNGGITMGYKIIIMMGYMLGSFWNMI